MISGRRVPAQISPGRPRSLLQIVVAKETIYGWDSTQWSETASIETKVVD